MNTNVDADTILRRAEPLVHQSSQGGAARLIDPKGSRFASGPQRVGQRAHEFADGRDLTVF